MFAGPMPVIPFPPNILPRRVASPGPVPAEALVRRTGVHFSMTKRMLIDTTHAEETRVVVLDGNRLEDYDVETSAKKQLKGNIYLAKVIRVEPSLQAAFVEYGGNRHGFLAFSEIHPDYYQIPVADRERLLALQEEEARAEEAREEAREGTPDEAGHGPAPSHEAAASVDPFHDSPASDHTGTDAAPLERQDEAVSGEGNGYDAAEAGHAAESNGADQSQREAAAQRPDEPAPESMGGEEEGSDDNRTSRQAARFLRQYKIQEVIRRRQILLIQVVKEERGNKGAALTTYISLAGRFCVLMPNSLRGGGVSRKITSAADRKRLKEITSELEIPRGMAMIVRTAGAQRPRPEIKRDCEYLLRLWDDIRETTMRSVAPALIYEEASLIKRAIRDVYTRDVEEIAVDGEQGWRAAREFMRMLMPANAQKVNLWRDHGQPLFSHYQVEHHLDAMLQPTVQLKSGGYLVINQTEALVAIDVNSGRSTRERGIEETALRTNLEAADELGRQLRLRDLAGLIVVDFIDMESRKHNAMVERRLKDALRNDRARIQVGTISHFGLLEMSRQRLRPSLVESTFVPCPHCAGSGFMRGTDSAALHVLRAIEEEGGRQRHAEIVVNVASAVALYVLNHKRVWLSEIEQRHRMVVNFAADDSLIPPALRIEGKRPQVAQAPVPAIEVAAERRLPANGIIAHGAAEEFETVPAVRGRDFEGMDLSAAPGFDGETDDAGDEQDDDVEDRAAGAPSGRPVSEGSGEGGERKRKRRRRSRRGGRRDDAGGDAAQGSGEAPERVAAEGGEQPVIAGEMPEFVPLPSAAQPDEAVASGTSGDAGSNGAVDGVRKGRRRGGRNRKPLEQGGGETNAAPAYSGPTPADPFGGGSFDIFDVIEQDFEPVPQRPEPEQARAVEVQPTLEVPLEPVEPEVAHAGEPEAPAAAEPVPPLAGKPEPTLASEPEVAAEAPPAKPKRKRAAKAAPPVEAAAEGEAVPEAMPEAVAKPVRKRAAAKSPGAAKPRTGKTRQAEAAEPSAPVEEASPAPEPVAAAPQPTPVPEPAPEQAPERPAHVVQPILVGATEAPAKRRTGWWKR